MAAGAAGSKIYSGRLKRFSSVGMWQIPGGLCCNSVNSRCRRKRRSSPPDPDPAGDAADSEWTDVETRVSWECHPGSWNSRMERAGRQLHSSQSSHSMGTSHYPGLALGVAGAQTPRDGDLGMLGAVGRDGCDFGVFPVLCGRGDEGGIGAGTGIAAPRPAQVSAPGLFQLPKFGNVFPPALLPFPHQVCIPKWNIRNGSRNSLHALLTSCSCYPLGISTFSGLGISNFSELGNFRFSGLHSLWEEGIVVEFLLKFQLHLYGATKEAWRIPSFPNY